MQVEAEVSGSSAHTRCRGLRDSGTRDQRALAAEVVGQYEGVMELLMFQWLHAENVQVESHTSSRGDMEKHITVLPLLQTPTPCEFYHHSLSAGDTETRETDTRNLFVYHVYGTDDDLSQKVKFNWKPLMYSKEKKSCLPTLGCGKKVRFRGLPTTTSTRYNPTPQINRTNTKL